MGSLEGVNSDSDLTALINGTKRISDMRALLIKVKVTQNTEAVDLLFGQYNNVIPTLGQLNGKIATLNNSLDTRVNFTGNNKDILAGTTFTRYSEVKNDTNFQNKCNLQECNWFFTLPYPQNTAGGNYEVRFISYKGELVDEATRGFTVNGQLPLKVDLLRAQKSTTQSTTYLDSLSYTNQLANILYIAGDVSKTYMISVGGTNYNLFTNSNGIGKIDITLPNTDGLYEIKYGLEILGKLVLDRVSPVLESVKIKKIENNENAISPFIRNGAKVTFEYKISKPTDENYFILENGYINYSQKGINNAFVNTVVVNANNEGIYAPAIYTKDYAGNSILVSNKSPISIQNLLPTSVNAKFAKPIVINPIAVNYDILNISSYINSRELAKDFSLNLDLTVPTKINSIQYNDWDDKLDGIKANGLAPEVNRFQNPNFPNAAPTTNTVFVTKKENVELRLVSEKNTRLVVQYQKNKENLQKIIVSPTATNCNVGVDKISSGLITKSGTLCQYSYQFSLNTDGSQNEFGEANNVFQFQVFPMDNSGNVPSEDFASEKLVISHDKTGAFIPIRQFSPKSDLKSLISNITNTNVITEKSFGESRSDITYELSKNNVILNKRTNILGRITDVIGVVTGNTKELDCRSGTCIEKDGPDFAQSNADFKLGNNTTDDIVNCTQIIDTRKVGICDDGLYNIKAFLTDSVGNNSPTTTKTIERDTVAPATPILKLSNKNNTITADILGEKNTTALFTISSRSGLKNKEVQLGNNSTLNIQNILSSEMECGGVTYVVELRLKDSAGNISQKTVSNIDSSQCRICTSYDIIDKATGNSTVLNSSTIWKNPLEGQKYSSIPGSEFGADREVSGYHWSHEGLDLQATLGTPIKPTRAGVVVEVKYFDPMSGNKVTIDHLDGYRTSYLHLNRINIVYGQTVGQETVIGEVGTTGNSSGPHLHFNIIKNGVNQNPALYLGQFATKLSPITIEENADYKLIRYGGDASCTSPLTLPAPKVITPPGNGDYENGEVPGDTNTPNLADILSGKVKYELKDPSEELELNYQEFNKFLFSKTEEYLSILNPPLAIFKCLADISPANMNPIQFVDSLKRCIYNSGLAIEKAISMIENMIPAFAEGFIEGFGTGIQNTGQGIVQMLELAVTILKSLNDLDTNIRECVKAQIPFLNWGSCDKFNHNTKEFKDFISNLISGGGKFLSDIWEGIKKIPEFVTNAISKLQNIPSLISQLAKGITMNILFPIFEHIIGMDNENPDLNASSFRTSEILRELNTQNKSANLNFDKKLAKSIGFVVGIISELATETAIMAAITAASAGTASPATATTLTAKLTLTVQRLAKFIKPFADFALFDGNFLFKSITLKSLNPYKVLVSIGKDTIQYAKGIVIKFQEIAGKIYAKGESLVQLIRNPNIDLRIVGTVSSLFTKKANFYYDILRLKFSETLNFIYSNEKLSSDRFLHILIGDMRLSVENLVEVLSFRGGHSLTALIKAYGAENIRLVNKSDLISWGAHQIYEADLEIKVGENWIRATGRKTFFPDTATPATIKRWIEEATENAAFDISLRNNRNTWIGTTNEGLKITLYNDINGIQPKFTGVISAYPKK